MRDVQKIHYHRQLGVTLVEMSIVLVIVGLIIASVVGGVNIKKASELRGIMTQADQFRVATRNFYDKYNALPGDMPDAYDYWGSDCNSVSTSCNGDGDGSISYYFEPLEFWQHLSLAGFLDGSYPGVDSPSGGYKHVPGQNCPATSRSNGGWHTRTHTDDINEVASTNIEVGGRSNSSYPWTHEALLTPTEAYSIDEKTDDGDPDNGKTQARSYYNGTGWATGCITGSDPDRTYIKTTTTQECIMFFDLEY